MQHVTRRKFLGGTAAATLVTAGSFSLASNTGAVDAASRIRRFQASSQATPPEVSGPFTLPPLPYGYEALEPHIDTETMRIHHDKHHQAYVDNLNKAVADLPELVAMSAEELIQNLDRVPEEKRNAVRNNAGGHVNHTMFWEIMGPNGGEPTDAVAEAIANAFGDVAAMQEAVNTAGLGRFGSGWAWVILGADGHLAVTSTPNQDNPLMTDMVDMPGIPILGVDVWEHAYYLAYQNKRADYLTAWWNTVNWEAVNQRFEGALGAMRRVTA